MRRVDFEVRSSTSWMRFWGKSNMTGQVESTTLCWISDMTTWQPIYLKGTIRKMSTHTWKSWKKHGYCTQFPISHIYSSEVPSIVWSIECICFELGRKTAPLPSLRMHCPVCKWGGGGKSREICRSFVPLIRWCIATRTSSTFKVWRMISQGVRWTLGLGC